MKLNILKVTDTELSVIKQGLHAVGWDALPEKHPERKAAESAKAKIEQLETPARLADTLTPKIGLEP